MSNCTQIRIDNFAKVKSVMQTLTLLQRLFHRDNLFTNIGTLVKNMKAPAVPINRLFS